MTEEHSAEKLLRLPNGFHCYQPPDEAPNVALAPLTANGNVTFGSFNNTAKVNREVIKVWAAILQAVPGSRLYLKSRGLASPDLRQALINGFAAESVSQERLFLAPSTPSTDAHLKEYAKVDIALDTFPYNGVTTTCEALWMGVPVLTLHGERHASRLAASLLTVSGLESFITTDIEAYIAQAVSLAGQPERLQELRRTMRTRLQNSPLCDGPGFVRDLDDAFRTMWRQWSQKAKFGEM